MFRSKQAVWPIVLFLFCSFGFADVTGDEKKVALDLSGQITASFSESNGSVFFFSPQPLNDVFVRLNGFWYSLTLVIGNDAKLSTYQAPVTLSKKAGQKILLRFYANEKWENASFSTREDENKKVLISIVPDESDVEATVTAEIDPWGVLPRLNKYRALGLTGLDGVPRAGGLSPVVLHPTLSRWARANNIQGDTSYGHKLKHKKHPWGQNSHCAPQHPDAESVMFNYNYGWIYSSGHDSLLRDPNIYWVGIDKFKGGWTLNAAGIHISPDRYPCDDDEFVKRDPPVEVVPYAAPGVQSIQSGGYYPATTGRGLFGRPRSR